MREYKQAIGEWLLTTLSCRSKCFIDRQIVARQRDGSKTKRNRISSGVADKPTCPPTQIIQTRVNNVEKSHFVCYCNTYFNIKT